MDRYRQRSTMAGYADEAYYSLFRLGVLRLAAGDGLHILLEAWQRCPHRWEPVHEAARWLNQSGLHQASYALSKQALTRPAEPSGLFISPDVYDHPAALRAQYIRLLCGPGPGELGRLQRPAGPAAAGAHRGGRASQPGFSVGKDWLGRSPRRPRPRPAFFLSFPNCASVPNLRLVPKLPFGNAIPANSCLPTQ